MIDALITFTLRNRSSKRGYVGVHFERHTRSNLTNRTPDLLAIHFKTSTSFTICTTKFASILKSFAVLLQQAQNPLTAIGSLNRLYRLPLRLGIPLIQCSEVGLFAN